jgi:hypothetical protein
MRVLIVGVLCTIACSDSPKGRTFYERNVEPILLQKCAGNTSGCHSTNEGDPFSVAAGNLDVTSFENVQKRRDSLQPFGSYPYPLFLIKSVGAGQLKMQYNGQFIPIDVQHSGGGILDVGSDAYFTLQTWLDNGATENGLKPATPAQAGTGGCSTAIPPGFVAGPFQSNPNYATFTSTVQPILKRHGCTEGSCHGAPQSDFYITCGDNEEQTAFNFSQAWAFVAAPVDDSQLLRVPLAATGGGRGHTGGDQFPSIDDTEFKAIRTWAEAVGVRDFANGDPVKEFFADNVMPVLLQRGCGFSACHSPAATNDFKLRAGGLGFYSSVALQKNYDLLREEFMALEFPDARRGRAVAKSILVTDPRVTTIGGIEHRGGPVLESPGNGPADPAACPAVYNPATASAFCTVQEWVTRERAAAPGEFTPMGSGDAIRIVYVERTAGTAGAGRLDVDNFQGGGDLKAVQTTFGADSVLNPADAGAGTSLIGGCGLGGNPDVHAPDVAHDGTRVAFAARASAADPLGVYVVNIDGSGCSRVTPAVPDSNGLKVHNFDPAWSPDGEFLVFSSTRGKTGAVKSRKRFLPQADLWRIGMNGLAPQGSPEQMTFLSNSEVGPQFMREGRVTMTTEKASDGFYQLAGRRINWDLTDYHPLLAQRKESSYATPDDRAAVLPSVDYTSATDIREGSNGDFVLIVSDTQANGAPALPGAAGALAIFNRSLGPFEAGRADIGYVPSMRILDGGNATGRAGSTAGYRGPFMLPDGSIMAAYASNVGQGNFEIVAVSPRDGARRTLFNNANGRVRVDAVLAFKSPPRKLYLNRRQLIFGGSADPSDAGRAVLHMPDAPMVFTLLVANLRRGRPLEEFGAARFLAVYSEGMCGANCTPGGNGIFESRTLLGKAQLANDGSVKVSLPAASGVVFELQDGAGNPIVQMSEEHQLGPGERVSMGVSRTLHNAICGGCHGSITGSELDVAITPDALTGASQSASLGIPAQSLGN